jgi:hypothetical protein
MPDHLGPRPIGEAVDDVLARVAPMTPLEIATLEGLGWRRTQVYTFVRWRHRNGLELHSDGAVRVWLQRHKANQTRE